MFHQFHPLHAPTAMVDKAAFLTPGVGMNRMMHRYKDIRELGHGNFGAVNLVADASTGAKRVRKTVNTKGMDRNTLKQMMDEITALAKLDSPYIVRIFEHAEAQDVMYIVEEKLEGGDVYELVKKSGPIEQGLAARYLKQAIIGLAYVHGRGILHRDIKPENMMLTHRDPYRAELKLIDFGLAAIFSPGDHMHSHSVAGTPAYMPLEVLRCCFGENVEYGEAFDMFSMGVSLFEMLTGKKVFGDPNDLPGDMRAKLMALRQNVERTPVPKMSLAPPRSGEAEPAGASAQHLVEWLLAKDQSQRCSAAQALDHPWLKWLAPAARKPFARDHQMSQYALAPYAIKVCLLLCASQMDTEELGSKSEAFEAIDGNGDGFITLDELRDTLPDPDQADLVMTQADLDGNGVLSYSEFVAASLFHKLLQDGEVSNTLTQRAFEVLDRSGAGKITHADLDAVQGIDAGYWEDLLAVMPDTGMDSAQFHSALVMMSTKERSAAPARPVAHVLPSVLPHQQTRVLTYGTGMALSGTARPLTLSGSGMHIQSLPARAPFSPRSPVATPAPGLRSPVPQSVVPRPTVPAQYMPTTRGGYAAPQPLPSQHSMPVSPYAPRTIGGTTMAPRTVGGYSGGGYSVPYAGGFASGGYGVRYR